MKVDPDKHLQRIFQDAYHIKRVLNSCETEEQLQNVNRWVNEIIEHWTLGFENLSVAAYYRYYKDIVKTTIEELHNMYVEKVEFFNNINNEENEKKKRIVVRGFQ